MARAEVWYRWVGSCPEFGPGLKWIGNFQVLLISWLEQGKWTAAGVPEAHATRPYRFERAFGDPSMRAYRNQKRNVVSRVQVLEQNVKVSCRRVEG
jgi:hypothetical protein